VELCLALREGHKLRIFENKVLRRILRPKRKEKETGENCITRSLIICTLHAILPNQGV
jgi:hypothetical protein